LLVDDAPELGARLPDDLLAALAAGKPAALVPDVTRVEQVRRRRERPAPAGDEGLVGEVA
jgi:hypothetical protein